MTYHGGLATHKILILAPLAYNLSPTTPPVFSLPDHALVTLEGPDAMAFAHAQFANDVAALAPGCWQWNAWLTPKGRVIAVFALARPAEDRVWLVLPDHPADLFAEALRRFVFRRKLKIEVPADRAISGAHAAPAHAQGNLLGTAGDAVELDMGGDGGPRTLRIGTAAPDDEAARLAWQVSDLRHGLPRLPASQREQWTPQQLALDRLAAYSVKKGCYPGQEIVARTHFRGKGKRELVRLQGNGVHELDEVMDGGPVGAGAQTVRPIGQLICAEGDEGLAVMPLDAGDGPFASGNLPCTRLPLLDGLAR